MTKEHIKYVIFVSIVAFAVWMVGEIILMFVFPESSMTAARAWVVLVFTTACVWSIVHMVREDKKQQEDEDNDNYKGVY